jgi:hypothetical protein
MNLRPCCIYSEKLHAFCSIHLPWNIDCEAEDLRSRLRVGCHSVEMSLLVLGTPASIPVLECFGTPS